MQALRNALSSPQAIWALLALPAVPMVLGLITGFGDMDDLLEDSGEFAAQLMIAAMVISPLRLMFPKTAWTAWLLKRRRYFGVAAFAYAVLHMVFYVLDMGSLRLILDEFSALGIWTGWAALAIFVPLAVTSNNVSQRLMKRHWKTLQRIVYPAAVLTLVHWIFVHNEGGAALAHFVPLAALEIYRIRKTWRTQVTRTAQPSEAN